MKYNLLKPQRENFLKVQKKKQIKSEKKYSDSQFRIYV